jgi:hypothetical protein
MLHDGFPSLEIQFPEETVINSSPTTIHWRAVVKTVDYGKKVAYGIMLATHIYNDLDKADTYIIFLLFGIINL